MRSAGVAALFDIFCVFNRSVVSSVMSKNEIKVDKAADELDILLETLQDSRAEVSATSLVAGQTPTTIQSHVSQSSPKYECWLVSSLSVCLDALKCG